MIKRRVMSITAGLASTFVLGTAGLVVTQAGSSAQMMRHHSGWMHRHPHLATAGAGIGAYELAKHSRRSGRGNWAQRHPFLTGAAAAGVAHHYAHKRYNSGQ